MAACERDLHKHVECVKHFLHEARTRDLPYAPGSLGDDDRCAGTRRAYADCRHGPRAKVEKEVIPLTSTQAQPMDFYKQEAVMGCFAQGDKAEHKAALSQGPGGPLVCGKELSLHGQCVENRLRHAMAHGTGYLGLTRGAEDKCAASRSRFDRCVAESRAIAEGRHTDPTNTKPWESQQLAGQFSVLGHW